jgi:hypothetical protein
VDDVFEELFVEHSDEEAELFDGVADLGGHVGLVAEAEVADLVQDELFEFELFVSGVLLDVNGHDVLELRVLVWNVFGCKIFSEHFDIFEQIEFLEVVMRGEKIMESVFCGFLEKSIYLFVEEFEGAFLKFD